MKLFYYLKKNMSRCFFFYIFPFIHICKHVKCKKKKKNVVVMKIQYFESESLGTCIPHVHLRMYFSLLGHRPCELLPSIGNINIFFKQLGHWDYWQTERFSQILMWSRSVKHDEMVCGHFFIKTCSSMLY